MDTGTRTKSPLKVVVYRKVRAAVTAGPDAGLQIELAGRGARVGTSTDNDLVLSDDTVSRHHCSIEPTERGLVIRDEGSTNGIVVDGVRVFDAIVLVTPAVLRLGDTTVTVTPLNATVDRERLEVSRFGDLVGESPPMQELFADLQRIAPSEVSVLVEGETGTGKELVAEAIHRHSLRADGPFVVFDCGAVAPNLAESELFGHIRGAFTGAVETRAGVFEQAHEGTIFLDELGELPKDLQPKLLRVLDKREVRPLGSGRSVQVNVRLVAATNRNLAAEVRRGNFREDLYFRLAGAHVVLPPLRNRVQDLPLLVDHFLSQQSPPLSRQGISPHVWEMFKAHRWPGNVRELKYAVQRLLVLPDRPITQFASHDQQPESVRLMSRDGRLLPLRDARREAADAFEREYLHQLLKHTENNVTRSAAIAEASRQMIQRLMRKHGL